jgi:hypothetical protein
MNYKIYKISNDEGQMYIGSTKMDLTRRLQLHKSAYVLFLNNKRKFYTVFHIFNGNNINIECLEELEKVSPQAAKLKETEYICSFPTCVNKNKAFTTYEDKLQYQIQYYNDNKEKCLQNVKQWNLENKDKYLQYQKQYYNENKEKHKTYYQTKKPIFKQAQKEYYEKNKDKIIERQKQYYKNKKQQDNN